MQIIDASNCAGGATVLLTYLSKSLSVKGVSHIVMSRQSIEGSEYCRSVLCSRSPMSAVRRHGLSELLKNSDVDSVLCFGNLPPTVRLGPLRVSTYFHNALLLPGSFGGATSTAARLRVWVLRRLIERFKSNTDFWVVQTEFVASSLKAWLSLDDDQVLVFPFFPSSVSDVSSTALPCEPLDFFYASSDSPHKNHEIIFQALLLCCDQGFYPTVGLTIGRKVRGTLLGLINRCNDAGVRLRLLGQMNHRDTIGYTQNARCIVFPSRIETVGLGLLEAADLQKPVIAGVTPWVDEIVRPTVRCDLNDPRSLASAMKAVSEMRSPPPAVRVLANRIDDFIAFFTDATFAS